ncbi:hypothetical protein WJX82_004680 [Trebouxia sp. C0006]
MLVPGYNLKWSKRHTVVALALGASASAAYTAYRLYRYHGYFSRAGIRPISNGDSYFEVKRAVDEYLQFHYSTQQEVLPYCHAPKEALQFIDQLVLLCERNCLALQDFTGEQGQVTALDLGCAVGGSSFALARAFQSVVGVDSSAHFIKAAQVLQREGVLAFTTIEEGDITATRLAQLPEDVDVDRIKFLQADLCRLPTNLVQFDAVLAANVLERLPDPANFLDQLSTLVKANGIAVLASAFSWSEKCTPKDSWLGGFYKKANEPIRSLDGMKQHMEPHFDLIEQEDLPYLIRQHARKYEWGVSCCTVWRRRRDKA